ncbi:hypothetical protein AMTRI_Chr06g170260 [Amborella trichopoda]
MGQNQAMEYKDLLPIMAEKLKADHFNTELNGFKLLANPSKGLITFESLKKNYAFLGLDYLKGQGLLEEALIHKIQGVIES